MAATPLTIGAESEVPCELSTTLPVTERYNGGDLPTQADWQRAEAMSADTLDAIMSGKHFMPEWIDQTNYFYYNVTNRGRVYHYLVNAATGKRTDIIPHPERFAEQVERITGKPIDAKDIKLYGYRFPKGDMAHIHIRQNGVTMRLNIATGELQRAPMPEAEHGVRPSFGTSVTTTDSLYTMMGHGWDLYIRNNNTGQIRRLTTDGKEDAGYTYHAIADTSGVSVGGRWVGHRYYREITDMSQVGEEALVNSLTKGRPTFKIFKMPMPGDKGIKRTGIYWYDADNDKGCMLDIDKYPDQVVDVDNYKSDSVLYFTRKSRTYDQVDLCRVDLNTGKVVELISETCKPHLNLQLFNYRIIDNGKHILWWSERTGRGNYYLYDADGRLIRRVTKGDKLVAGSIVQVNTQKKYIIFQGYGQETAINPHYTLYYKATLDGRHQTLLTPGDGTHELTFSRNGLYFTDVYSRPDAAPMLRTGSVTDARKTFMVDSTDTYELRQHGYRFPIPVTVTAADGHTPLYGVMYLPSNLDKTKKYPVISNVYPGPQDDQIPRQFTLDDNYNQSLAELGFVVINVPSRGSSPLRGRDFYCYGYGNLRDYPLEDDKNTIRQLAQRYPFMDLSRVGIYGHSGGGFEAATAFLTSPDFYKVAVAASGNYDNNIYIQWWGELFHGLTQTKDAKTGKTVFTSKIPTTAALAENLKGRLMLITGDVDNNVLPSSTYRLADALIKAGKRFDMFVLPGKDHGVMCPYYVNLIRYYFVEHLINPTHQHDNIINHQ